jgi:hypothetical protein
MFCLMIWRTCFLLYEIADTPYISFLSLPSLPGSSIYHRTLKPTSKVLMDSKLGQELDELLSKYPQLVADYIPVDRIGEGTFSTVYKAIDVRYYESEENERWDRYSLNDDEQDEAPNQVSEVE